MSSVEAALGNGLVYHHVQFYADKLGSLEYVCASAKLWLVSLYF